MEIEKGTGMVTGPMEGQQEEKRKEDNIENRGLTLRHAKSIFKVHQATCYMLFLGYFTSFIVTWLTVKWPIMG